MSTALTLGADGWIDQARRAPSPNCDAQTEPPQLLVIHHISLPPGQFAGHDIERLFTNTLPAEGHPDYSWISQLRVSAHWLIRRDGELVQFVSVLDRAWHAGRSSWQGRDNCNDFSIGVELEGLEDHPFDPPQYETLQKLIMALTQQWPITTVVGHEHVAPGRKNDPGKAFDWDGLKCRLGANHGLIPELPNRA